MSVRLNSGDASRLEQSLLIASANQLEAQRVETETQITELMLQIKTLAGISPEEPLLLRGRLATRSVRITQETALQIALQNRPDLRAARLREETAEAKIALAKAEALPNISLFVRYTSETNIIEGLFPPEERIVDRARLLSFGISVPLPLFNRGQGNVAETFSQRMQARAQREAIEQAVRRDVSLAYRRYEAAQRRLDLLSRGVLEPGREVSRIVLLACRLGETKFLDVMNQQRLLLEAQMSYLTAQKDSHLAVVAVEHAVGRTLESLNNQR